MSHLEKACEKADLRACASLAEAFVATKTGADRAEGLARRACDGGVARGCSVLADLAKRGQTKQAGTSDETVLLQKACDGGELAACVKLAERLTAAEPGKAASVLQRACDTSSFAPSDLTKLIAERVVARTGAVDTGPVGARTVSIADLSAAGSTGSGSGGLGLGGTGGANPGAGGGLAGIGGGSTGGGSTGSGSESRSNSFDDGIDRGRSGTGMILVRLLKRDAVDVNRAMDRADAGEPTGEDQQAGCIPLGEMHEKGIGFPVDPGVAERFYGMACSHTDGRGCARLGALEERAKKKDRSKVSAFYARACELQDAEGCVKAGTLAAASSNKDEAADSFELACDLGSVEGCLRAGMMNEGDRHYVHALELFDKGCETKDAKLCAAAAKLRPRVDAAEAAAAKRRPASSGSGRVDVPKGDAIIGAVSASVPVEKPERTVARLRPRVRACYQRGLYEDPTMTKGALVIIAKLDPTGTVSSADVTGNIGLSQGIAQCVAGVVKRATFSPPSGGGSTLRIPILFVQK